MTLRPLARLWLVLLAFGPLLPLRAAEGPAPEAVLKAKGLKRSGNVYVLPDETGFQKSLNAARNLYRAVSALAAQKQEIEQGAAASRAEMEQMEQQRIYLNQQLANTSEVVEHNRIVGMLNAMGGQLNAMRRRQADPDALQVPGARLAARREDFIQAVLDLRLRVDQIDELYANLAKDTEVAGALAALSARGKTKFILGPSRGYVANVELLKRVEGSVLSERVPLRKEGGVYWVDATFNGKVTRPMVFDTGASSVVLPAELAEEIGLKPGPNAPKVKAQVADGSVVEARLMVVPSLRVGKFTVKDVECLVMPAGKADVPPLLGQTFQRHFTSKFNAEAGQLTLSKVDTPEAVAPAPAAKTRASSRSGRGKR